MKIAEHSCEKMSKNKAAHTILKRIRQIKFSSSVDFDYFFNPVCEVKIPKDVEKLIDIIFYSVDADSAIEKIHKSNIRKVQDIDLDLQSYFAFQYIVDSMLATETFIQNDYSSQAFSFYYVFIHSILEYISLLKFNTVARYVTGIDLDTNRLKFMYDDMQMDKLEISMRCTEDRKVLDETSALVAARFNEAASLHNMSVGENAMAIYDRLDDSIRQYRSSVILADMLSQTCSIDFVKPSMDILRKCLVTNTVIRSNTDMLYKRKRMTPKSGVLLRKGDLSCIFKEILIGEYNFLVYSYKDGDTENTGILPMDIPIIIQDQGMQAMELIYDYYSREVDKEDDISRLNPDCWRVRRKNYEGHEQDRHYFEKEIEPFKRKAAHTSENAKALARKHHFYLPDGYTFVTEHVRHYNKDLMEENEDE